jgi:hypothetical protein
MKRRAWLATALLSLGAAAGCQAQPLQGKDKPMSSPLVSSQPSPPEVPPIEHAGVRYEQDRERQRRADAQRGGWVVAFDARTGARLWEAQVYANPYDGRSPAGSPARWFSSMRLAPGGDRIEIEDTIGARFELELKTGRVTQTFNPDDAKPAPRVDKRPKFD